MEPSIKGAAVVGTLDRLQMAIDAGVLGPADLERKLDASALRLASSKIEPSLWYPVAPVAQIGELLMRTIGNNSYDFMVEIGCATAKRFQREGVFKVFIENAARHGERVGQTIIRISELAFNFGSWSFEGNLLTSFEVTMRNADPLPEATRYSVLGFTQELASDLAGTPMKVVSLRPEPGIVLYQGRRADA